MHIKPGDTVQEISTGRLGRVQSMEGENQVANLVPGFIPTKWHVWFTDDNEPKSKVFTNESELRLVKTRPE
jgi:hypothetical protein